MTSNVRPLPKISIASITKNFYNGTTAEQLNKAFQTTQHLRREKDRLYSKKIKNNMLLQESDKLLQKTVEYIMNNHFNEYQDFFLNNKTLANTKEKEEEKDTMRY